MSNSGRTKNNSEANNKNKYTYFSRSDDEVGLFPNVAIELKASKSIENIVT